MWIVVSLPFWFAGSALAVIGFCAILYGFICVTPNTPQKQTEFNVTIVVAFAVVMLGGSILVLAAKIAS